MVGQKGPDLAILSLSDPPILAVSGDRLKPITAIMDTPGDFLYRPIWKLR